MVTDGKVMKDSTNKQDPKSNVDRLPVVVTGHHLEKVLGVSKISSGTGDAQAKATFQLLVLWEVVDDIIGMSFDTTAANTGATNGACVLLEKQMGRNLLYFACRHHIHELIVANVFSVLFGPSKGPNISLFQRFQQGWAKINHQNFKLLDDKRLNTPYLQDLKKEVTSFLKGILLSKEEYMPRDDYKEMVELCLLLLGELPTADQYRFKIPGAYHMARWMAKVIYCWKIFLFRAEFKLTVKEEKNLTEFCLFACFIYVKAWISCPKASDAPVNDLRLFKQIKQYSTVNAIVSEAAMKKLKSHLWYLGPELILLSLFSDKLPVQEKRMLANELNNIKSFPKDWTERGIKLNSCDRLESKSFHNLVNYTSVCALNALNIDLEFINIDPDSWNELPKFQEAKHIVDSLRVVNDAAERSVALMSAFNESITKNETEMQKLIQVVEDHRKRVPDARKVTLKAYNPR